ncbi:uncharacterized protein LOC118466113 isoform X2 [Anopheles albimanus]|uniref:uncharacterized protein LOC118466113 isoform X2 n=1 Tax=Anopheles albimanus TaxID=7167 RepID=UPI001641E7F9|nr:uncharacterized protein LOC118466113 isoform X2 [Anopheles albimanus]
MCSQIEGSSTDIGPSVLGYLDSLADNFSEQAKHLVESSATAVNNAATRAITKEQQTTIASSGAGGTTSSTSSSTLKLLYHSSETHASVVPPVKPARRSGLPVAKTLSTPTPTSPPTGTTSATTQHQQQHQRPFCWNLSPTVQRIVVGQEANGAEKLLHLEHQQQSTSFSSQATLTSSSSSSARMHSKSQHQQQHHQTASAGSGVVVACHKNLPLTKGMAKLAHANSELIDHFLGAATPPPGASRSPRIRRERQLSPRCKDHRAGVVDQNGNEETVAADDAAAAAAAAADDHDRRQQEAGSEIQNVTALQRKIRSLTVDLERSAAEEKWPTGGSGTSQRDARVVCMEPGEPNDDQQVVQLRNDGGEEMARHDRNAFVDNCGTESSEHRNTVVEARNLFVRGSRRRLVEIGRTKATDGELTAAAAGGGDTAAAAASINASIPSLDASATSGSSGYSSKASLMTPSTPVLNSRPLSASSIGSSYSSTSTSSTSTSSSLGSENLLAGGRKCSSAPSYQASVESLADHSEPEPAPIGSGNVHGGAGTASVHGGSTAPGLTMCERAVREIIESESSYVKDLGQVIRGYLEDWKERACLKPDQLKVLFSNIQEIYDFNCKLLNRLHEAKGDPGKISNCFIDLHAGFSCYTSYCTSYPEAISLLTSLLQATHTNALLVSTQKHLKHTLPLGSYLLKPVQRILKYHLLLDNLRKHCSYQQPVVIAFELMKQVAHNIDQVKTKLDQHRLVKELAGVLDGWLGPDLSVLGDLLHEGRLTEQTKPRYVLLFQTMLIITKPKEDKRLQFRAYIPCKNLMLVEHLPGEPASFNVIPFDDPKGVVKLTARSREEKRFWTQQIKQAMLEHYDIPKRAKELVLLLGDEDERFTDKPYWKRPTNSSTVPEYLERRQQFRRSEMRMRSKKNLLKKDSDPAITPTGGGSIQTRPSFRSYSQELESGESSIDLDRKGSEDCAQHRHDRTVHQTAGEECKCDAVKKQLQEEIKQARPQGGTGGASRRRPNVPDASEEELLLVKSINERRKLADPCRRPTRSADGPGMGIKTYNSTMIPKRISEMRKRRPKTACSNSTFYTDLSVDSTTASGDLQTTTEVTTDSNEQDSVSSSVTNLREEDESSCRRAVEDKGTTVRQTNPNEAKEQGSSEKGISKSASQHSIAVSEQQQQSAPQHNKKDSEIICQLLLDREQFHKLRTSTHKPTKKKSLDGFRQGSTISLGALGPSPLPPSTEPPPLTDESPPPSSAKRSMSVPAASVHSSALEPDVTDDMEPIYESLLRNVHVPYKYAPAPALALVTRHSLPCGDGPQDGTSGSIFAAATGLSTSMSGALPLPLPDRNKPSATGRTRPESDYVTLTYTEDGMLDGIVPLETEHFGCNDERARFSSKAVQQKGSNQMLQPLLHNSDTNISYHRDTPATTGGTAMTPAAAAAAVPLDTANNAKPVSLDTQSDIVRSFQEEPEQETKLLERQGSLNMKSTSSSSSKDGQKSILQRFMSLHSSLSPSVTPAGSPSGSDSNLFRFPLNRKLSEPNGGGYSEPGSLGHIYKQGSVDLGSRIANLDYADPRTLFTGTACGGNNVLINRDSIKSLLLDQRQQQQLLQEEEQHKQLLRDSVLASSASSSSSSESVGQQDGVEAMANDLQQQQQQQHAMEDEDDDESCCFYERTVEECLEQDFRDSAVYSGDDIDRRMMAASAAAAAPVPEASANQEQSEEHLYEALTPPAELPPERISSSNAMMAATVCPPPIPVKPSHLLGDVCRPKSFRLQSVVKATAAATSMMVSPPASPASPSPSPLNNSKPSATTTSNSSSSRGWVLQQVRRFQ